MSSDGNALAPLLAVLALFGLDGRSALLGLARVLPLVLFVPAFGLRALAAPVRVTFGLTLALCAFPAARAPATSALVVELITEFARGLPIAITTAGGLWVASMAGGVVDDLRGSSERAALPHVEGEPSPFGALFAMLAGLGFLMSGGPARAVRALAEPPLPLMSSVVRVAHSLSAGMELAVAIAAPLVVVSVLVELAGALVARAAAPASVAPLLQPLRAFVLLGAVALLLERIAALVVTLGAG